mgnify:CR=1 FL=1
MKTHLLSKIRWLFAPLLLATLSAQPLANERYTVAPAADAAVAAMRARGEGYGVRTLQG